ncbi:hypothetical protein GQ607_015894 [Colletotrichum asianum]|uniref:Uncharacterized protein n=1 Tax=Colletotrichum asianum TaxID=702518 RepID=A0A8H3W0F3_9PEZI|nr:hypothetical protein GQ607_015894 [Colletotrichum asianum]
MPPRKRRATEGTPASPEDRIAEALSAISEALDDIAAASPNLVGSVEDGRDAQSVVRDWVESHRQYADGLVCKCGKDVEMSYVFAKSRLFYVR